MSTAEVPRHVTIRDVARAAGVSRSAVSKVIRDAYGVSPAMRERVTQTIEELGYRPSVPARALRGSSYRLGIEVPQFGARFMVPVIAGARAALEGTPYQLVIAPAEGPEHAAIEALADGFVDGIVAISPQVTRDWLEAMAQRVPSVMVGRHDDGAVHYDNVVGDDASGARQVMEHLLELGHTRIAYLIDDGVDIRPVSGSPHSLRLRLYRECLAEAGLEASVVLLPNEAAADDLLRVVRETMAGDNAPTAIFASHDDLAFRTLGALTELGYRRGDVSIAGYDDTDLAAHPLLDLTSVHQFGEEMGRRAITCLLERIEGRTEPVRHVLPTRLEIRSSTGPPRR